MSSRPPQKRRARGGQDGYEPPAVRMRRDERILELALERLSQRQIAAEVGLTQAGVSKALRRILQSQAVSVQQDAEIYRVKLLHLAERRARAARDGHTQSTEDVTTRRQRQTMGADGGAFTTAEYETQSSAGNPQYLAVEQRCDEFVAQLLGLHERQVALTPADNVLPEGVRQLKELSTETLERVQADLNRSSEDQKIGKDRHGRT